jgi:hypothetical protein
MDSRAGPALARNAFEIASIGDDSGERFTASTWNT